MLIVIDTAMIFSLLLGKNAKMRDTFFEPENHFYAPNSVIGEIFEKKEKILRYSALSEAELYELLYRIFEKIRFVTENLVSQENRQKAYELCRDIVEMILELLSSGMTVDEILSDYENLEREDILAALAFAARLTQVKRMQAALL